VTVSPDRTVAAVTISLAGNGTDSAFDRRWRRRGA
jgi:hypothetical protein